MIRYEVAPGLNAEYDDDEGMRNTRNAFFHIQIYSGIVLGLNAEYDDDEGMQNHRHVSVIF